MAVSVTPGSACIGRFQQASGRFEACGSRKIVLRGVIANRSRVISRDPCFFRRVQVGAEFWQFGAKSAASKMIGRRCVLVRFSSIARQATAKTTAKDGCRQKLGKSRVFKGG